ncbi:MAG TPA: VWA domain-containing protein [Vicinamibacterales bacterium]|nr:VWA domain-containing protein [Vicinamibacterales bacterium]
MARRRLFVLTAVVAALGAWPTAQQKPPAPQTPAPQLTFRAEGNYIEVDTIVTDAQGNFVRDLTVNDFELSEEKKPQAIDLFTLVDIPLERADAPLYRKNPIAPDVATNQRENDGRLYVIVLDANHVPATDTILVKNVAKEFIQQNVGANDQAAVVLVQTAKSDDNQEFTSDKIALMRSVDKFIGEKIPAKAMNVMDQINQRAGAPDFDPREARDMQATERAHKAGGTVGTLTELSKNLAGIRGRKKAIIFFSEGIDFNTDDTVGPRSNSLPDDPMASNTNIEAVQAQTLLEDMQILYETATRANVAIYSVDPRGPAGGPDNSMSITGMTEGISPNFITMATAAMRADVRRQVGTLRTFSEATGGIATVGTNDFAGGFKRIVEDNSAYYVLGYHPTELKQDGKFHEISVKVKRPGVQVRARKGYYATKPDKNTPVAPADPTIGLLNSPLAVSGLGLRMTTSMMKGDAQNVRVVMTIDLAGSDLGANVGGTTDSKVDLTFAALDTSAKVKASGRKALDLALRPETRAAIVENGLRLVTELQVPPGRYQLRLAANAPATGRSGSVFTNIDVPDLTKGSIAMGNVLIASSSAGKTPTSIDAAGLKDLLPGPPTTSRTFALEDTIVVFGQVYDNESDKPHTVDLSATVRDDTGTQAFVTRESRDGREIGGDRGYAYVARVPLQDLVPGRYVLTVQAKSRLGGDPATKEIEFTIK